MQPYIPTPIDTTAIRLPASIIQLRERLAQNAHDTWAVQRMKEGWTFGPARDDTLKHHPCLVPYDALHESEKEYDRLMVDQVLKTICALDYRIEKRGR